MTKDDKKRFVLNAKISRFFLLFYMILALCAFFMMNSYLTWLIFFPIFPALNHTVINFLVTFIVVFIPIVVICKKFKQYYQSVIHDQIEMFKRFISGEDDFE